MESVLRSNPFRYPGIVEHESFDSSCSCHPRSACFSGPYWTQIGPQFRMERTKSADQDDTLEMPPPHPAQCNLHPMFGNAGAVGPPHARIREWKGVRS